MLRAYGAAFAVAGPRTTQHETYLARGVDAVFSRRPPEGRLAELPRYDDGALPQLRSFAERTWRAAG